MRILDVLGVLWGLSTALVANAAVTANVVRPKGIWKRHDTFITVTNATLYQWKRGHQHAYQVKQWEAWPDSIDAGQSVQVRVKRRGGHKKSDSAAEVQYWLVGTSERMEMQFEYRTHQVRVRYMEELATMGQGRGSEQVLGFETYPGGVGFVLAGSEAGGFVANGAPAGWMQATLRDVGHLPLRQLAMPRTHHTGMWKGVAPLGFASKANTLTQMIDLWTQLTEGGVRVLDVRATWMVHWKWAQWREAHTIPVGFYGIHGMLGAGIEEMVDVINRFNDEFPGELIILDMHSDAMRIENSLEFRRANKEDRADLYRIPERALRGPDAVAASPLRRFVGKGAPAVLVRVDSAWAKEEGSTFPGGTEGFVRREQLPYRARWSDMSSTTEMVHDQLEHLAKSRPNREAPPSELSWLTTLTFSQTAFLLVSIVTLNQGAWPTLYYDLWEALTDQTYPNWITVDALHGGEAKALSMAINLCLGVRRCGSLGGKIEVDGSPRLPDNLTAAGEGQGSR